MWVNGKELNKETDIKVLLKEIKSGRKVSSLVFDIKVKAQKQNDSTSEILIKKDKTLLLEKLNDKANNYQIDLSVFSKLYSVASVIYKTENIEIELLGLVELTNKKTKRSPIEFMLHIINEKQKLYNNSENQSVRSEEHTSELQSRF